MGEVKQGLESFVREDGIHVFRIYDFSRDTYNEWESEVIQLLDNADDGYKKRLYNVKGMSALPFRIMQSVIRFRRHRNSKYVWLAVVINNSMVWDVVDIVLRAANYNKTRIVNIVNHSSRSLCIEVSGQYVTLFQPEQQF